jgi:hypothetical protein
MAVSRLFIALGGLLLGGSVSINPLRRVITYPKHPQSQLHLNG